jgi:hypothetical protein
MRRLFAGLLILYAFELGARNIAGLGIDDALWWFPARADTFHVWQPVTRYFVQGNDVVGVLLSCLVLYFFGPFIEGRFTGRQLAEIGGAVVLGGTGLAGLLDAFGILAGPTMGWDSAVSTLIVLFGLASPGATIRLFFVLPIPASTLAWGTGVVAGLFLLASPTLATAEYMGVWIGTIAWWFYRGPGAKRRAAARAGRKVERDLQRFQVLPGGRGDDDLVH